MRVCELSAQTIEGLFHKGQEGSGAFGTVVPYNRGQLIKLYQTVFCSDLPWQSKIREKIAQDKKYKMEGKKLHYLYHKCAQIEKSRSGSYIDAVATYQDYPIGVIMKWYQEHQELRKIYPTLSPASKKIVELKIWRRVLDLEQVGIYPYDLKGDNVLVHPRNLDTVLIDLDDGATKCDPSLKWKTESEKDVEKSYQRMISYLRSGK